MELRTSFGPKTLTGKTWVTPSLFGMSALVSYFRYHTQPVGALSEKVSTKPKATKFHRFHWVGYRSRSLSLQADAGPKGPTKE